MYTLASTAFQQVTSTGLLAIPMFVLMANLLIHSGIADRLYKTMSYWLSGVRGSVAGVFVGRVHLACHVRGSWFRYHLSPGKLFIAGIIPGFIAAGSFVLYIGLLG